MRQSRNTRKLAHDASNHSDSARQHCQARIQEKRFSAGGLNSGRWNSATSAVPGDWKPESEPHEDQRSGRSPSQGHSALGRFAQELARPVGPTTLQVAAGWRCQRVRTKDTSPRHRADLGVALAAALSCQWVWMLGSAVTVLRTGSCEVVPGWTVKESPRKKRRHWQLKAAASATNRG